MFDSKYSNVLTIILIVLIIVIVGLLSFLGYDTYKKYFTTKDTSQIIEEFDNKNKNLIEEDEIEEPVEENTTGEVKNPYEGLNTTVNVGGSTGGSSSGSSSSSVIQYKGFNMMGKIKIPRTNLECPILETVTPKSIEVAVAILYGPGLNQVGNTVIVGHNYRNGLFFSNNKKLENGDKIYITDNSGKTIKYNIYNIFITTPEDSDYMVRDTNGTREISLSTCTDDSKSRLIICAREE